MREVYQGVVARLASPAGVMLELLHIEEHLCLAVSFFPGGGEELLVDGLEFRRSHQIFRLLEKDKTGVVYIVRIVLRPEGQNGEHAGQKDGEKSFHGFQS